MKKQLSLLAIVIIISVLCFYGKGSINSNIAGNPPVIPIPPIMIKNIKSELTIYKTTLTQFRCQYENTI